MKKLIVIVLLFISLIIAFDELKEMTIYSESALAYMENYVLIVENINDTLDLPVDERNIDLLKVSIFTNNYSFKTVYLSTTIRNSTMISNTYDQSIRIYDILDEIERFGWTSDLIDKLNGELNTSLSREEIEILNNNTNRGDTEFFGLRLDSISLYYKIINN